MWLIFGPQVTHLLPADTTNLDDYILLHPDAAKYIWFPDIYIGNQSQWRLKLWQDPFANKREGQRDYK